MYVMHMLCHKHVGAACSWVVNMVTLCSHPYRNCTYVYTTPLLNETWPAYSKVFFHGSGSEHDHKHCTCENLNFTLHYIELYAVIQKSIILQNFTHEILVFKSNFFWKFAFETFSTLVQLYDKWYITQLQYYSVCVAAYSPLSSYSWLYPVRTYIMILKWER